MKNQHVIEDSRACLLQSRECSVSIVSFKILEGGVHISSLLWRYVKYEFLVLLRDWDWKLTLPKAKSGALLSSKVLALSPKQRVGDYERNSMAVACVFLAEK